MTRPSTTPRADGMDVDGCHIAAACRDCPLSVCVFHGFYSRNSQEAVEDRRLQIADLRKQGLKVAEIARQIGTSERTVYHDLQKAELADQLARLGDAPPR